MKLYKIINILVFILILNNASLFALEFILGKNNFPVLKGLYFGQKLTENSTQIFAPGLISTKAEEFGITFSPDRKELYFTRKNNKTNKFEVFYSKLHNNIWTFPSKAVFLGSQSNAEPNFSPDGKTLYFGRPVFKKQKWTSEIWFVNKMENKFSNPKILFDGMYLTSTKSGTVFFTDVSKGMGKGDIVCLLLNGRKKLKPVKISTNINSTYNDAHPFIDPDGYYLIFDSNRLGGYGDSDLYITFKQKNGKWSKAINMGKNINSFGYDGIPSITPDKKYLFFSRVKKNKNGLTDIYWVSAKIIEYLRVKCLE